MAKTTPGVSTDVSVQDLLSAGLHFGHQTKRWNPKMKRFIFDARNGIYIIDLAKSLAQLKEAQQFIYDIVARGRKILFVGTKKQAQDPIRTSASKLNQPYVVHRWLGGTLTNNETVRRSVSRMRELEQRQQEDGTLDATSKKEAARLGREYQKLHRNLSGVADMDELPGALFVVDVNREKIAVAEANRLKIPVVAIVDTNTNPEPVDYPIPGNDDAIRAIQLIIKLLSDTIQQASNEYAKVVAEEARRRAKEEAEAAAKAAKAEEERKVREEAERRAHEEARARQEAEKKAAAEKAAQEDQKKTAAEPAPAPEAVAAAEASAPDTVSPAPRPDAAAETKADEEA